MVSTTALRSSAFSPNDAGSSCDEKLAFVAALADPRQRLAAARSLAAALGAEDLLLFGEDPEIGVLLPAPGFPQTLLDGLSWQTFLHKARSAGLATGHLTCPSSGQVKEAVAVASSDGSVLVLLGGSPRYSDLEGVAALLPLLGAAFRGERLALAAEGQAAVARESAARAEALAESLDRARRELGAALSAARATAAENARLYEEVREGDRRKNEFLAVLAHEERNYLAPIRNAIEAMRRLGLTDPNARWAIDVVHRQVVQLARLVDDLLDVTRIARGKLKLQKEPLELAEVIAQAVETCQPLVESRRHVLTVSLPSTPIRLQADRTRLGQVLTNLLTNSAKYTPEGGRIWLTAQRKGGEVAISVRDSGVGIPTERLVSIFELFSQIEETLERSQGGLGLGLSLVRSVVELHGGTVEAASDGPGRGSTFTVRLPLLRDEGARAKEENNAATSSSSFPSPASVSTCRILVVDDNPDAAESLALLLRLGGHEVQTAHDGPAALEAAHGFRPQVVLLDLGLPGMDGFEVARRLRLEHPLPEMVLIALTGYGTDEDRRQTREAGFDDHLVKPVEPDHLQTLLARLK